MAIDLNKTQELVTGGLLEQDSTWANYAQGRHTLQDTAVWLTLPIVIIAALAAYLLRLLFDGYYIFGGSGFGGVIAGIIGGLVGIAVCAAISMFFANFFSSNDGVTAGPPADTAETPAVSAESSEAPAAAVDATFDQAFAAVSFGFLPALVGSILGTLPWIGWLLSLGASIYALICLYRLFPVFLPIAEPDRMKHFIATILTSLVAGAVLAAILGSIFVGSTARHQLGDMERHHSNSTTVSSQNDSGFFGLGAGVNAMAAAAEDRYEPPADGRLADSQVKLFTRFMVRTQEMREEYGKSLDKLSDKSGSKEGEPSLSDLMSGFKGVMNVSGAETQVVKSGGGNWAEHNWVKSALIQAKIQKDLNETIAHNYRLYQKYEDQLGPLL